MRSSIGVLVLAVLSSCGGVRDPRGPCQSLCGCWEDTTLSVSGSTRSPDGGALAGINVSCRGDTAVMDVTDAYGAFDFHLATQESPGCGFQTCNNLVFTDPGGAVQSKELNVKALRDGGTVTLEP